MRIKKGFWLWGLFSCEDKDYLDKIKEKVQKELYSPRFETHITLAGPYLKINKSLYKELEIFTKSYPGIILKIKGYQFKKEKFESFYIRIHISKELKKIRKDFNKLESFDLNKKYTPHISLTYGNHINQNKKSLISKLPEINRSIKISKIALVEVNEDNYLWQIRKTFDLQ